MFQMELPTCASCSEVEGQKQVGQAVPQAAQTWCHVVGSADVVVYDLALSQGPPCVRPYRLVWSHNQGRVVEALIMRLNLRLNCGHM